MVRIEDWAFVYRPNNFLDLPELRGHRINGRVYGHPRFDDGEYVTTSPVMGIDSDENVVTYSGTRYQLGVVREEYEYEHPNARERFMKSARELGLII